MKWSFIGLMFLITNLSYGQGHKRSREENNSKEFSILENKVTIVINELKALKEEVNVLKGEPTSEPDPDLVPLEASRMMLPGGRVRFTLKYRAKPAILENLRVFWSDTEKYAPIQESLSNEIPRLPPDVYESSTETEASNTSDVYAYVGSPELWYRLTIKNALEGNTIQPITSLPECHMNPSDDIVYQPGTNASIKIAVPLVVDSLEDPDLEQPIDATLNYFINAPGSGNILEKYYEEDYDVTNNFHQPRDVKKFFNKMEVTVDFNTSVIAYSGLVMMNVRRTYSYDLVHRIEKNFQLTLHPSNQSGPFREGLLAFRHLFWLKSNANGDHIIQCRSGELCRVYCQVFGNSPNEVVMLRTVNGVAETIIPPRHEEGEYMSYALDTFRMTSDPNPINYTCIGSDGGGRRAVSTYIVNLRNPPTFVDDQTHVEVSPEGDINVTCTATGSPLPQMNITLYLMEVEHDESSLEILYQTNDTISVSKVVNLHNVDRNMLSVAVFFMYVSCEASNTGGKNTKNMPLSFEQLDNYLSS